MAETWFIDAGSASAGVARLLAYGASGGAEGVYQNNHMAVLPMQQAGPQVRVLPGGATILNRSPNAWCESYIDRFMTQEVVDITPTGSGGGRSDLIVRRIEDPQFPPWQLPQDPRSATYGFTRVIEGVDPSTTSFSDLGLSQSAYALARIDIPANTAAIDKAMIVPLLNIANPKKDPVLRPLPTFAGAPGDGLILRANPGSVGERFPNVNGAQSIPVPEWAVRAQIEWEWLGIRYASGTAPWGEMWVSYGPPLGDGHNRERHTQKFMFDASGGTNERVSWKVADDVYLPKSYRGTDQMFVAMAQYSGGEPSTDADRVKMDARSGMVCKVTFLEVPDPEATS